MKAAENWVAIAVATAMSVVGAVVATATPPEYVPGEVIVTFKKYVTTSAAALSAKDRHAVIARQYRWISEKRKQQSVLMRSESQTTAELIADLRRDPRVETAEPNYLRRISTVYIPDDPRYGDLWALRNTGQTVNSKVGTSGADIGFAAAWPLSMQSTGEVVVAVIDTGCDYLHPDLASNIWCNANEIPGNGVDDDENGYIDDYRGFDFASTTNAAPGSDADPMDSAEHGTHVCGTIAAVGSNSVGVIGVNPRAHIMIVKASGDGNTLPNSSILAAYDYVATMKSRGVNVVAINASYGGGGYSSDEFAAMTELGNLGVVFCAAAGNAGTDNDKTPQYPASYTLANIIAVAATDQNDSLAGFSNYGATSVDLAAPGENILSCKPTQSVSTTASVRKGATTYNAAGLTYAGVSTGITATAYNCAYGAAGDFPPQVAGNIALIQRGSGLTFSTKVLNAMTAGAAAAIIYNNVSGNFAGTLQTTGPWIPTVSVSQANGQALLGATPTVVSVVNRIDPTAIYQFMNGTSMATPHVAGAVSFLALNFPEETVAQRIQRVLANVVPVSALSTKVKSKGRLSISRAIDTDLDNLPDWWERRYFGGYTSGNPGADSNGNGVTDLAEWEGRTSPTYVGALVAVNLPPMAPNGIVVHWSSETGNLYRVERSTNLLMESGGFSLIASGVPATPPSNTHTDTTATATGTYFYRVELRE